MHSVFNILAPNLSEAMFGGYGEVQNIPFYFLRTC